MASQASQLWLFEPTSPSPLTLTESLDLQAFRDAPPQPVSFCVLGSGSGGNSSAIRVGSKLLLIDLGFPPRTITKRLRTIGGSLDELSGVCLTHMDGDHFSAPWINELLTRRVPLFIHQRHVHALYRHDGARTLHREGLLNLFEANPFEPWQKCDEPHNHPPRIQPIHLPHDENGSQGFVLHVGPQRIGYATDLGQVPAQLIERFAGVDLLAIESNYDPKLQRESARPWFLKQRIMGSRGHLSNEQSFEAVVRILDAAGSRLPQRIVLLHRSRQCNCPHKVRELFTQDDRIAPRLVLSEQSQSTQWMTLSI